MAWNHGIWDDVIPVLGKRSVFHPTSFWRDESLDLSADRQTRLLRAGRIHSALQSLVRRAWNLELQSGTLYF